MHLVFLNQYYPPDAAPTGVMLAAVVEELAAQGHEVTVICAEGGYAGGKREALVGGRIQNPPGRILRIGATRFGRGTFWGKLLDYFSYYIGVAWRLAWMTPKPERIVALTTPPYLSLLARAMSKPRGADHAHWVMDLYPDVMVAHGMLREGGWKHRLLAGLARWGFGGGRCAAVLTLGPDMAERVGEVRNGGKMKMGRDALALALPPAPGGVAWVPLWWGEPHAGREKKTPQPLLEDALRAKRGWREDELIVMYSGNMGLGHRFGEILEVVGKMEKSEGRDVEGRGGCGEERDPRSEGFDSQRATLQDDAHLEQPRAVTRFVFFGGGKRRGEIERFVAAHPGAPVELHEYAPEEILAVHLRSADVHLASLDEKWTGTMLPSKLQGIFAAGRPVIFIGDARSSIGRWVSESGGGRVVKPGDVAGLAAAINEARDPQVRESQGRAAQAFAAVNFDRKSNVRRVAGGLAEKDRNNACCGARFRNR